MISSYRNVIDYLMENKKIADATHNITAYRIQMEKGNILQVIYNITYILLIH